MTIQVEISSATEAWLAAQAASQSMDVSSYAALLLERAKSPMAVGKENPVSQPAGRRHDGKKSLTQLFAESPFKGLNLDFEGDRGIGRDASL